MQRYVAVSVFDDHIAAGELAAALHLVDALAEVQRDDVLNKYAYGHAYDNGMSTVTPALLSACECSSCWQLQV